MSYTKEHIRFTYFIVFKFYTKRKKTKKKVIKNQTLIIGLQNLGGSALIL